MVRILGKSYVKKGVSRRARDIQSPPPQLRRDAEDKCPRRGWLLVTSMRDSGSLQLSPTTPGSSHRLLPASLSKGAFSTGPLAYPSKRLVTSFCP